MDEDLASGVPVSDEANSSRSSEASVFPHSPTMPLKGDSPTTHPWNAEPEQRVLSFNFASETVAGVVRQISAKVTFDLSRTRSEGCHCMRVKVVRADLGVSPSCTRNCFEPGKESCLENCTIDLIYKIDIQVTPLFGAENCQRLEVRPDHIPQEFYYERHSKQGCQIPLCDLLHTAFTSERGTTVSRSDVAHGWGPSSRVDASKEAFFHWNIRSFEDGSKFEFKRLRFGTRPLLPINPSDTRIPPGEASPVEAFWDLKPELERRRVQFEVRVTLYTAVSKRLFRFYNVTKGPKSTSTRTLNFTDFVPRDFSISSSHPEFCRSARHDQ